MVSLIPQIAFAQTTVNTSEGNSLPSTRCSTFATENHQFIFYGLGNKYKVSTTIEGTSWGAEQTVPNILIGSYDWEISYDATGGIVNLVTFYGGATRSVEYIGGTVDDGTGTISWGSLVAIDSGSWTAGSFYSRITTDSNGYKHIIYNTSDATKKHIVNDTPHSTTFTVAHTYTSGVMPATVFVPLTNGKLAGLYISSGTTLRIHYFSAGAWSSPVEVTTSCAGRFSGVSEDDEVHIVYLKTTSYDIAYRTYDQTTNSVSAETILNTSTTAYTAPTISFDNTNDDLWIWYQDTSGNEVIVDRYDSANDIFYVDQQYCLDNTGLNNNSAPYIVSAQNQSRDTLGVFWSNSAYYIRWKYLSEQFNVDTLVPTSVTETQATLRGEIVSIGWGTPTERGLYWNTTPSLAGAQNWHEHGSFSTGVFTHTIGNLSEGEAYYYIAYAMNAETAYGEWVQFVPGGTGGWAVSTLEPDPVGDFEATFRGEITKVAGTYATRRGFEYGFTATATWSWEQTGNFTVGVYSHQFTSLYADQIYYVRAFVGNSTVLDYGQWIGFMTEPPGYIYNGETLPPGLMTAPIPTTAPGGWVRTGKTYDGFPFSSILNDFFDLSFGRSWFWFVIEVGIIFGLTILLSKFTRNLPISYVVLLFLFLLPFIAFEYLDWWMLAPYLVVGASLMIKEGQFSWS